MHAIGRALGKAHPVIHLLLKRHGGIAPLVRHRSRTALTLQEREDISRGIACGSSLHAIAKGPEKRVPADHPLRPARKMVDEILREMSPKLAELYSKVGRPSIRAGAIVAVAAVADLLFGAQ